MKNLAIRYGLMGGSLSILLGLSNWFLIARHFGPGISQTVGYFSLIISLMCIPLGIKYFRDELNNGVLSFKKGFSIGLGITMVTSIMMFFYSLLFFVLAEDDYKEWSLKGMTEEELKEAQVQMASMPDYVNTPLFQGFILFLMVLIIGLIINTISSLALSKAKS